MKYLLTIALSVFCVAGFADEPEANNEMLKDGVLWSQTEGTDQDCVENTDDEQVNELFALLEEMNNCDDEEGICPDYLTSFNHIA